MKRIIHIVGSMNRAGAETMIMNLYRQLDCDKFQFDFLYFTNKTCDYDEEILDKGGEIHRVLSKNVIKRYLKYYSLLKKNKQIDYVHSHMNINNSMYLFFAYLTGKKIRISHSHGTEGKYHQSIVRKLYKFFSFSFIKTFATKYVACGEAAGKYLYPKVDESKIIILPNAIDVKKFSDCRIENRNYIKNLLEIDKKTIVISQVGRLSKVKNHVFSLRFLKYLKGNKIKFHYVIVGDGELMDNLKKVVEAEGLDKEVTFLGVRSDVPELFSGSDAVLMPSLHEGFPVVLVESQAIGVPSLISDTISREVDLGLNLVAFLSLKDDFSVWKEKLLEVVSQGEIKLDQKLKTLTEKGFNIVDSVKKLEMIYGE